MLQRQNRRSRIVPVMMSGAAKRRLLLENS
jgi:hypothetical protein